MTTKRVLCLAIWAVLPISAWPQAFRCIESGRVTYQDRPCSAEGQRIELSPYAPTTAERELAGARVARERRLVDAYDADHERDRATAERFRARQEQRRAALDDRCARYEEEMERVEKGRKGHQSESVRNLRAKHFSECFSQR